MRGRVLGKGCGRCREGGETDRTSVKDLEHWSTHRQCRPSARPIGRPWGRTTRSEEHTSELQSLMRISYAVFCLKKNKNTTGSRTNKPHREKPSRREQQDKD